MLKDDFYQIVEHSEDGRYLIRLRSDHPVYDGHFPGQPVVPGVCLLQIALELTEVETGTSWRLRQSRQMKFSRPVVPQQTPELWFALSIKPDGEDGQQLRAQAEWDGQVYFKVTGRIATDVSM